VAALDAPAVTDLQLRVLRAMRDLEEQRAQPHTPNEIGWRAGAKTIEGSGRGSGRGSGHRVFGKAQQIIPVLTSLRARGLIALRSRPDGWSGTAYELTDEGRAALH